MSRETDRKVLIFPGKTYSVNPRTGKGWTDAEEETFAEIMRVARMGRMDAIRLYRRCKSDSARALRVAKRDYGMTDEQAAARERNKAARLAGLAKARQNRALKGGFELSECPPRGAAKEVAHPPSETDAA